MTQAWKQWEGEVLNGEFHLRQYLGGSDHSAVFLTEDRRRGLEKVAIKLIPADPETADLQITRWKAAAKLSHPQLIRLYQMGNCQLGAIDLLYVVMEYAEMDLSQILRRGPLPPTETLETVKLILNTLAYLHGKGFVHSHLKPSNIMGVDNQMKLSSDGICRIGELTGSRGEPGAYDPPEAADGIYSPAGDVWSLGMTMVEVLPERPPMWVRTEEGDPVVPRTLPPPFFDIARNCLRWDPERRWTLAQIGSRLETAARVPPLPGTNPQIDARPQEMSGKRRYLVPAVVVAVALAVVLAAFSLLKGHRAKPESDQNPVTSSTELPVQKHSREQQASSGSKRPHPQVQPKAAPQASATAGAVQDGVRKKVLPNVSQSALDTIRGTVVVTVKVAVDPSGNVAEATLDSAGPSKYFARLSLEAAQQWKFQPMEGEAAQVSKERLLEFRFEKTGTAANPVQTAP